MDYFIKGLKTNNILIGCFESFDDAKQFVDKLKEDSEASDKYRYVYEDNGITINLFMLAKNFHSDTEFLFNAIQTYKTNNNFSDYQYYQLMDDVINVYKSDAHFV
ncbi:hypothetical protein JavanS619_0012 [Streptococcus satellite phage Javan619]|uniref:hypothetical protein n=1 Tax=Streptococcus uberis TaxID=1349 RepID=UPI0006204586|nr:hypothetical protein [Streptococcus uberis]KKF54946.1 hypothetical protein AF67_03085 [Streptococcus uberis 6780]QBX11912.1 hypothetical protein JavanS619_0012 [Streptococcus satellite phage Javan619]